MPDDMSPPLTDPARAIVAFLSDENDVLRSAAVRALARVAGPDHRTAFLKALLDPDPDVRTDAMDVLAGIAHPQDAETLRRSLEGDPVREVKVAAIRALGRLKDHAASDGLRALALSRCDETIAWEDENSDWEDWLDVQIAAIEALGCIGTQDAIADMMAARDDEMGQTLDIPVFEALSKLGEEGIAYLLAIIETEPGLAAQRAAGVLSRVAPTLLEPHLTVLISNSDPVLRRTAVDLLAASGEEIAHLVATDPDATVRIHALRRCAPLQPEVALEALQDASPDVAAAALRLLRPPLESGMQDVLVDNMLAWVEKAPPGLMCEVAMQLPYWAPDRAVMPLKRLAGDEDRPLQARVAAVRGLGAVCPPLDAGDIVALLHNPAQQVRTAALVLLRARAETGDPAAVDALIHAIDGTLLPEGARQREASPNDAAPDLAMPKGEDHALNRIRITRDGDIVEAADEEGPDARSTLGAILRQPETSAPPLAEDTPEERPEKRRKRRAVEGPDDIAEALSREALQIVAGLGNAAVDAAVVTRAADTDDPLRRNAWQALEGSTFAPAATAATHAIHDDDPLVRLIGYRLLLAVSQDPDVLVTCQADSDALVRVEAVRHLPSEALAALLSDPAPIVRKAIAERMFDVCSGGEIEGMVAQLLSSQCSDTLAFLWPRSSVVRSAMARRLSAPELDKREALIVLNAFASPAAEHTG
ncbi:MAG: HEAT repeat domain-containing protein [Pseudomonadota bacterium]